MEGDVTIYASTEKYNVTNTLSHITSKNGNGTTIVEKNYTDVLIPESGYELPRTIEVTVSGRTLVVGTDYTYDIKTGQVNINADKVTGDIEIKAVGTQIVYDVELSGNNISATEGTIGTGKAMKEKQYETVLTPNVGYLLPDAIVVEVSGKVLTSGTDYTYDNQTGRVVIYNKAVTGNVKIVVGMLVEASVTAPDSSLIKTKNPAYLDSYDGEISGVTPAMEYSSDNGDIWNRCVSTKMTGLSVGTYLIRYAATPSQVASPSITVKLVCKFGELNIPTIKMSKILEIKKKFRIKLINTKGAVVTCKSSNTKIAVVNKRGLVKSKTKTGKAKIVIGITKGRHKVQYIMNVTVRKGVKKNYSLVRFNTKSKNPSIVLYKLLEKGASWKIRLAHTNKTTKLNFKSSDKKIAEINKKGKITSKSLGKAIITARVKQNGVTNIYYVVVRVTDGNRKSDTSYLKVIK